MTRIMDFQTLMSEIRATFDLASGGAISKDERTRLLEQHVADADLLRKADATYIRGYINGRQKAQDEP